MALSAFIGRRADGDTVIALSMDRRHPPKEDAEDGEDLPKGTHKFEARRHRTAEAQASYHRRSQPG